MRFHRFGVGVLAVAATVAVGASSYAGFVRQAVHGRLAPSDTSSRARGVFHMGWVQADNGTVRDRLDVACQRLDARRDDQGNLPVYELVLTTSGGTSYDFGDLTLTRNGNAGFRFNSRVDAFEEGITSVADFSGGTIEVKRDGSVVLSGDVPTFVGPGDDSGTHAIGVRRDSNRLRAEDGYRARGAIEARYANTPRGVNEQVRVKIVNLSRDGAPYDVVVIDANSVETLLFQITPRGRYGEARGELDTRDGDTIPGPGSVTDLSELDVQVRDKDGTLVLTGKFPTITLD
jgi:hypothetical protein